MSVIKRPWKWEFILSLQFMIISKMQIAKALIKKKTKIYYCPLVIFNTQHAIYLLFICNC